MSTTRESTAPLALLSNSPARASSRRRRLPQGWEGLAFFAALLLFWQILVGILPVQKRFLFPAPGQVAKALWDSLPELGRGTLSSFLILIPGYIGAVTAGILLGIVAGSTGWFMRLAVPFSRVVAPVPPTVYIPYAIALLPGFRSAATAVVFIGAFWPVFVNSLAGAAAVPGRWHDNARVLGLHKAEFLWRVVLPASLTHVFAGMSVGLAMSFIMLTVAELFGANAGLGRFVQFYADYADYPRMVAGILYTGAITFVCMHALDALRRKVLFWKR